MQSSRTKARPGSNMELDERERATWNFKVEKLVRDIDYLDYLDRDRKLDKRDCLLATANALLVHAKQDEVGLALIQAKERLKGKPNAPGYLETPKVRHWLGLEDPVQRYLRASIDEQRKLTTRARGMEDLGNDPELEKPTLSVRRILDNDLFSAWPPHAAERATKRKHSDAEGHLTALHPPSHKMRRIDHTSAPVPVVSDEARAHEKVASTQPKTGVYGSQTDQSPNLPTARTFQRNPEGLGLLRYFLASLGSPLPCRPRGMRIMGPDDYEEYAAVLTKLALLRGDCEEASPST